MAEQTAYTLTTIARELAAHMDENELSGAMETQAWAGQRNVTIGWAVYDAARRVVTVTLTEDELTLVVGTAVTLHRDPAFYRTLLAPEDE